MSVFLKMMKSIESDELNRKPFAWSLICLIARRACRETRTALIGDYKSYGMTKGQYRSAKKLLADKGYCAFCPTNKGTVATLLDDRIFDINAMDFNDTLATLEVTPDATLETAPENELKNSINDTQSNMQSDTHHNPIKTPNKNKELNNIIITKKVNQKKKFKKPSVEEIREYCEERNNGLNPGKIFDHYEANGWKRGKTPIKNWKACVRTWEGNINQGGSNGRSIKVFRNTDQNYKPVSQTGGF